MILGGKILITGGAGTLGRALIRYAEENLWKCSFTVMNRSELLQANMRSKFPSVRYVLGDVRDYDRLLDVVAGHDIVIHAAAMKRIPEAEVNPTECYMTNVMGSINVARACINTGVRHCAAISTDKACKAVTAYGASKLAMEKLFQSQSDNVTSFTVCRYGNVVASRGSVIPLWKKQAQDRIPLTITDRRMTRFWMSIREAVELVVRTVRAPHGTIMVPRMSSMSIMDMARAVCPDSEVSVVGLRSCEKLHEDLVSRDETVLELNGKYFMIHKDGLLGYDYTSESAPRLSAESFLDMLACAEEYE